MAGISSKAAGGMGNKFQFGGKELQSKEFNDGSGLDLYDFEARYFDPEIGRWHNLDPLADKAYSLTPYRYSFNNPMLFVDPDGRWEFKVGTRAKKDKEGETEKYLMLVKTDEKNDNLTTLGEQLGIDVEKLKSLNLDLTKEITGLGDVLKFSIINDALNYSKEDCVGLNNCWNASQELASGLSIGKTNKYSQKSAMAKDADQNLKNNFTNVKKPQVGDIIRFAQAGGNDDNGKFANEIGGTSHYANFMLKNEKGTQVFTKNGIDAEKYEVMYTKEPSPSLPGNKSLVKTYGNPTGLQGDFPYYRKK